MNNFLAMLDKLAQKAAVNEASVRVFKLEANSIEGEPLPAPERLPLDNSATPQAGQSNFGRKRRPKS
ncbi:hypothetical protein JST97_01430 [bacterium]|nr:hypothetical protein [bacterium]